MLNAKTTSSQIKSLLRGAELDFWVVNLRVNCRWINIVTIVVNRCKKAAGINFGPVVEHAVFFFRFSQLP